MAMAVSRRTIVGNIGKIYPKRTVGDRNQSVIEFSVAVTMRFKDSSDGEWKDGPTEWHTVKAWGQLADNVESSWKQGDRVFVSGRVEMKPGYTDKNGQEHDPRPVIVAEMAGHENSKDPSTQQRTRREGGYSGGNNSGTSYQGTKPAPKAQAQSKPAPAASDDDDDLDDLLGDLGDDSDDGLPF